MTTIKFDDSVRVLFTDVERDDDMVFITYGINYKGIHYVMNLDADGTVHLMTPELRTNETHGCDNFFENEFESIDFHRLVDLCEEENRKDYIC